MTWLLHDSKGLALVKCISSCMYERRHPAWKSCVWTQGICIPECNGLGVGFFKYSNEPQIKQDFYCIWYSANNKKQGNRIHRQRGMGKRGDTLWCPYCYLVHSIPGRSSPHLLAAVWRKQLRPPSVEDAELKTKSAEFSVRVKTARLNLRTSDYWSQILTKNHTTVNEKQSSVLYLSGKTVKEVLLLIHTSTGWLGIKWGLATSHSRSLNSSFMYKLWAEVSSRKILPVKCLWPQLIQKKCVVRGKKKYGSQQGYIHADCVQLYMM